jgi:hypothetical protein
MALHNGTDSVVSDVVRNGGADFVRSDVVPIRRVNSRNAHQRPKSIGPSSLLLVSDLVIL